MVRLVVPSRRASCQGPFQACCCQGASPWRAPAAPRLRRRPSSSSRWVWFSLLCGHCPFPLGPVSPRLCKSCKQTPLASKVRFPGDSQSLLWSPRLGSLTWDSEPLQQWEDFLGITALQCVGWPPSGSGLWSLTRLCPSFRLCCRFLVFGCGASFWGPVSSRQRLLSS